VEKILLFIVIDAPLAFPTTSEPSPYETHPEHPPSPHIPKNAPDDEDNRLHNAR
jgi:hypothetical protein